MRCVEDTLGAMTRNRQQHELALLLIRQQSGLSDSDRRVLLMRSWVRAMKRHYRLLDRYLSLRQRDLERSNRSLGRAQPRLLEAPARPPEVPEWCSRYI